MRSRSAAMLSLVPQCHNDLLVPKGTTVSNMFPSFQESLRINIGPLIPRGTTVSQWPHDYTRSCSVTMLCMVQQGPAVSQWHLWFHEDPECHNGLLASMYPHSVTAVPWFSQDPAVSQWRLWSPKDPQCHSGPLALWCHVVHSVTMVLSVPRGPAVSQWPLDSPGPCSVTIITESPRLEKTFESIKPNL